MSDLENTLKDLLDETDREKAKTIPVSPIDNVVYYKGFDKDLKCRGFQFEVGETYEDPRVVEGRKVELCYSGFHFCSSIKDVDRYYNLRNESNRVCIIKPLGENRFGTDKHCSSRIKIVKELSKEEIERLIRKENEEVYDKKVFCIDVLKELQSKFNFTIGGSCALHLQGIHLERLAGKSDFDIIVPYFQSFSEFKNDEMIDEIEEMDGNGSGGDFDKVYLLYTKDGRFLKLDVRVDPYFTYRLIEYKGSEYKVADVLSILEAKIKYAKQKGKNKKKHRNDIINIINKKNYYESKD